MGFIDDLLNDNTRFRFFDNGLESFMLANELLDYYDIKVDTYKFISRHTKYIDIYNTYVVRLILVKDNKDIGTLGFRKRDTNKYEISYYVLEKYRGKVKISSYIDTVYEVCKRNNISLSARVKLNNVKSISIIEKHLKLDNPFIDSINNIAIYGGVDGESS